MLEGKENKNKTTKVDSNKLNDILGLTKNVLNIIYVLGIIICGYVVVRICQELKVMPFIVQLLSILAPLFIGIVIAWIFNPFVNFLQKKGVKRIFGVTICYIIFLGVIGTIIGMILPILYEQILSFTDSVPNIAKELENIIKNFKGLDKINGLDVETIKSNILSQIEKYSADLSSNLPKNIMDTARGFISGLSTCIVGLVIGFFLLLGFDNIGDTLIVFAPKKWRNDIDVITARINKLLRKYVLGVVLDAMLIFVVCSLAFTLTGLRAPLLFALFCAITNVIPYFGPYIGAVPALIVAFSMSPTIGLFTLLAIVIIQFVEGNFLQDIIMAKTTNLHPVTIITGLLIFGHYLGILGMVISTPIIAIIKQLFIFINEKKNFIENLKSDDSVVEEVK